ncbi:hypothetical protein GDO86_005241 [Hymenochirus boettgeri]|uniref:Uncharacterized protein n=1 Tax=Hymenochirus boettgeri TaxID=247094 RepID=A0A8T2J144_9PIPI|nr:hypothetical protein GDO86_005241 [Hymenochirus boettgeri]
MAMISLTNKDLFYNFKQARNLSHYMLFCCSYSNSSLPGKKVRLGVQVLSRSFYLTFCRS